ncbi:MAG TPA: SDR family NAD(P)-dependent oxidoreductase, partial [Roseiflexaceae bacterium]|nr:SDR family NAD(P)-dependent oxidoreductase [Roseiflexaceae bacterium]
TTIWSAAGELRPDSGPVTLGPPIANTQLYVLDPQMQLVPPGVPGELFIGGDGLARGYGGRPDLTAERFVPNPFGAGGWGLGAGEDHEEWRTVNQEPGLDDAELKTQNSKLKTQQASRLYKTGDLVRRLADGRIEFLGRLDHQVKVRGFRIELGEIELALAGHPALRQAVVLARADGRAADKQLVAYAVAHSGQKPTLADLRAFLRERLPDYMIPTSLVLLEALPLTPNGKIDRKALPAPPQERGSAAQGAALPRSGLERTIAAIWREVLQREQIGLHDSFFDLGGHSMLLAQVHQRLRAALPVELSIVELFQYPTVAALARYLSLQGAAAGLLADPRAPRRSASAAERAVAIVGMAGRFPGADDIEQFWANLRDGVESITFFSEEELLAAGVAPAALRAPNYVRARATLADADLFDAAFFGFTPREAEILDPQHRVFLEAAWNALEHAGYDSERYRGRIGVFAGVGINSYLLEADRARIGAAGRYQAFISNDKDFAPTRVSYKLNLRGPSVNVQTACSSSLVALHLACQSLLTGESDMALAGGVTVGVPQQTGYFYEEGGIPSPDGHCRAFDAEARGTVFGSGVGVVLLKPLADALADGDTIYAVVKGTAINNDGAGKIGYTAPSVDGQAEVIDAALAAAEVSAETIGYVEAHGTGTALGDPIEIAALSKAFRAATDRRQFCAIGSLKTNIGHLDTAAGVAGLVKTALALRHGLLPPSLHYQNPNPQIDFAGSPFFVNTALRPWPDGDGPRRAGVSSFGIGGTNAHVILEEAPAAPEPAAEQPWQLLLLAARTPAALEQATERLAAHLRAHPEQPLADVAYTLQVGRRHFPQRRALVCRDRDEALALLEARDPARLLSGAVRTGTPALAFMFPGQGAQYPGMARDLYGHEAVFREAVDRCADLLQPLLGLDIRPLIFEEPERESTKDTKGTNGSGQDNSKRKTQSSKLTETQFAQPALFVVEYALAQLWQSWGVVPSALIGHSIGEYVAATLAGVFRLEDALALVAARGRLMQALPAGAMLSVQLPEGELLPLLDSGLSLAAVNGPRGCVAAGPEHAVAALEGQLVARAIPCRRLHTSHAFHSAMMDPLVETFAAEVARTERQAPQLPFVSNRTGTWITAEQATDPRYWAEHLRHAVRFADGISTLLADPDTLLLEVGPGTALSSLARQVAPQGSVFACMRHPGDSTPDQAALLGAAARLWLAGVALDWAGVHTNQPRRRVALPTYPFERKRFWIGGRTGEQPAPAAPGRAPLDNWFYTPLWRQTALPEAGRQTETAGQPWLVFADSCGVAEQLRTTLEAAGRWVATVEPGGAFRALGAGRYQIRPDQRADYDALLDELSAAGLLPHTVVHAWSVAAYEKEAGVRLERAQALGFDSLLLLAQALARQKPPAPVQIGLVTGHMQRIAGEHEHAPEQAICLGLCRVIPQELPGLTCRSIDIALERDGGAPDGLGELLLAELSGPGETQPVAYRGEARWVQTFEPLRLAPPERPDSGLRQGGVYLITGGLGGIGLTLARHLADSAQARLVLTSRRGLPPRAEWPALLAEGPEEIRTAIQAVQALEAQGSPVLALQADVADVQAMRTVVQQTLEHFGALHGVIHAAGVPGGGVIQLKTREAAARVLAPKLQGTLALLEATRDLPLDLVVLCSSITAVAGGFGQSDYCGANAFLDALAAATRRRNGPRVVAINWDRWREVGMAVRSETAGGLWALQQGTPPVRHPLLDRCLLSGPHAIYWTELGVERHWVLSEHLIAGLPTVPGTSYLEMARAAFAHATGQRDAELREVIFVAPLTARPGERKDVLTILEQRGEGYEFRVVSRARPAEGAPGRWQEHARGRVRAAGPQPAPLAPAALAEGLRPLDLAETASPRPEGSADFLVTGPRWDNLRQVFASDTDGLALLELRDECAGDLRDYTLHPALLDTAAGAVKFMGAGDYLPLTYASIQVFQPFPARIYSAIRPKNGAGKDVLSCDISILDEEGAVLALIEGFSMRRITPALLAQLQSGGIQPAALLDDASAGLYDELLAPALADAERGIAPDEGIAAFTRILAGRAAQVIVSTGDLAQEQERVGRLTGAQLVERLARPGAARTEAPASLSGINASEIEQRLIGIWRSVLGVEQIGVNDNFFELGGTSLSGIQVIAEIKHVFGVDIPAVSIFDAPTVSALVRYLQPTQQDQTFDHSRDRARKRGQALDMFKGGRR